MEELREMNTDKHQLELHLSDHPIWTPHRSASSLEPVDLWHDIGRDKSKQIGSPPSGTGDGHDELDESFGADEKSIDLNTAALGPHSYIATLPPRMAAFDRPAELPTSLSAHNFNHQNSNYTDLAELPKPLALEERLETMRARNAEENYHDRIPPQDAPPHLQVMVLLYQWAAWAFEVPDQKRREDLIRWVNGRFVEFMMAGGHVPGYNLKELLQLAGVDPKELYGCSEQLDPLGSSMEDPPHICKQTATHGGRQLNPTKKEAEVTATEKKGPDSHVESSASDAAGNTPANMSPIVRSNEDDDEEGQSRYNDRNDQSASTNDESVSKNWDVSFPIADTAMGYEEPVAITKKGKRNAASVSDAEQDGKRQEIKEETADKGVIDNNDIPDSQTGDLNDAARTERYRQSFFKARLNTILRDRKATQYRKDLLDWPSIEKRLKGVSINTIKSLRDDFYEGWKTWDGSDFSGLRNSSQSSGREEKAKADFIFPPSTPAYSRSESVVRPQPNKAKPRSRKRVLEDDYDTLEDEWTAAKTSVRTRRQAAKSIASTKRKGHRGRPRKN